MHEITTYIFDYVEERVKNGSLVWPHSTEDAILFAQTEISEAIEVLFARKPYIRNHPENKPKWSQERFAEELGDAIFMLLVAGIMMDVDPILVMLSKHKKENHACTNKD